MPSPYADLLIRAAGPEDEQAWRPLWSAYNVFYGAEVPTEVTDGVWRRIVDPSPEVGALLAVDGGRVVGFAVRILHPYTWGTGPACLLEDLFVDPTVRGRGVGRALIEALRDEGLRSGWERLYWHTKHDNAVARRLYDTFTEADGFVRYALDLQGDRPG